MKIKHKAFKGNPGLVITQPGTIVEHCCFVCFDGMKKVSIETLIRTSGRWLGGIPQPG